MSVNAYPTENGTTRLKWRENGKQKSKTVKDADVVQATAQIERRLGNGQRVANRKSVPTLEEFGIECLAFWKGNLAPSTLRLYAELLSVHVNPTLGHLAVHPQDLSPRRLGDWQTERLVEGAGPAVLGKAQTLLQRILHRAVIPFEYLEVNPMVGLEKPAYKKKSQRWLAAGEVEAIRSWFIGREDFRSATLVSMLAYVGPRPQEILARRWTDLREDPPGWVRTVGHGATGLFIDSKNERGVIVPGTKVNEDSKRTVYLPAPVRDDLRVWRPLSNPDSPFIFAREDGSPWTKDDYDNWASRPPKEKKRRKVSERPKSFRAACEAVDLGSKLTPYHLRHTAATLFAAAGWNGNEIGRQLEHSAATSARIYQHLLDDRPADSRDFTIEDFIREARGFAPTRGETGVVAKV